MRGDEETAELEAALADADRGELDALDRLEARGQALPTAWLEAIAAAKWLAGATTAEPLDARGLEAWVDAPAPTRHAAARACRALVRWRTLAFDAAAAANALELHARFVAPSAASEALWVDLERAWLGIAAGTNPQLPETLSQLGRAATSAKAAALVVEAAALRALAIAATGDLSQALSVARRASRMARTESFPQSEYLAGLVLARLRRLTGHPHLATRILAGLERFASAIWRPWIEWETGMSTADVRLMSEASSDGPAASLVQVRRAAARGDVAAFDDALAATRRAAAGWAPLLADLDALRQAIDARVDPLPGSPLWAWRTGTSASIPNGLDALAGTQHAAIAYAVIQPDASATRILAAGVPLLGQGNDRPVAEVSGRPGRPDALLATVGLAGADGIDLESAFAAIYGFSYAPSVHRDALNLVVHRARARLGDHGQLVRDGGHLRLRTIHTLVVADPRCKVAADSAVLQLIAREQGISAKAVSEALDIPLRTVQHCVRELVELRACRTRRAGRDVLYEVEDTTFQEPTRAPPREPGRPA